MKSISLYHACRNVSNKRIPCKFMFLWIKKYKNLIGNWKHMYNFSGGCWLELLLLLFFLFIQGNGWDYYYDGDHYDGYIIVDGVKYCDQFESEEIVTISPGIKDKFCICIYMIFVRYNLKVQIRCLTLYSDKYSDLFFLLEHI